MSWSTAALLAMASQDTDEVLVILLNVSVGGSPLFYITSDSVETVSRGSTYIVFPFDIYLPGASATRSLSAKLSIFNADLTILDSLRSLTQAPIVTIELVLASAPDEVLQTWPNMRLQSVEFNSQTITGDLIIDTLVTEPYPKGRMTKSNFPGMYD